MKENLGRSGFVLLSLWAAWAGGRAEAQSCQSDDDCSDGYVCETYTMGSCSGQACAPGEPCPEPVCEEVEYSQCTPAPCSSDADCGGEMVCATSTSVACSDKPRCAPGSACEADGASAEECTETTTRQCAHRWQLPCESDSDCGEGFRCRENVYWVCDGGTARPDGSSADGPSAPDADGATGIPVEEPNCYPLPAQNSCELLELPCDSSADCGDGFECRPNPSAGWGCGVPDPTDADGAAFVGDDGSEPNMGAAEDPALPAEPVPCEPPADVPEQVCMPIQWGGGGGDGSSGEGSGDNGADGAASGDGATEPPEAPSDGSEEDEHEGRGRGKRLGQLLRALLGGGNGCSVGGLGGPADLSFLLGFGSLIGAASLRRRRSR